MRCSPAGVESARLRTQGQLVFGGGYTEPPAAGTGLPRCPPRPALPSCSRQRMRWSGLPILAQGQLAESPFCWLSRTNTFSGVPGKTRASAGWDHPRRWQPNFGTAPLDHRGGPGPSQALAGRALGKTLNQPHSAPTQRRRRPPNYYSRWLINIHEGGRLSPARVT